MYVRPQEQTSKDANEIPAGKPKLLVKTSSKEILSTHFGPITSLGLFDSAMASICGVKVGSLY